MYLLSVCQEHEAAEQAVVESAVKYVIEAVEDDRRYFQPLSAIFKHLPVSYPYEIIPSATKRKQAEPSVPVSLLCH